MTTASHGPTATQGQPDTRSSAARARWLTGAGPGALSVVELSGDAAWPLLVGAFRCVKGALPPVFQPGLARLGSLPLEGGPADQILLVCRQTAAGPTVELQSHHGLLADRLLRQSLEVIGFSFESAPADELAIHLIRERDEILRRVPNRPSMARLLRWADEVWPAALTQLEQLLLQGQAEVALVRVNDWRRWTVWGQHLVEPFRVAITGVPNAGKSSLLNALLGFERALVSPVAGTTRDPVRDRVAYDGWVIELVDTAGLRQAVDPLEISGIQRARQAVAQADLLVWLVDPENPQAPPPDLHPGLVIATKADLVPDFASTGSIRVDHQVSAHSGLGLDSFLALMLGHLLGAEPPQGTPVAFSPGLSGCLDRLANLIQEKKLFEAHHLISQLRFDPSTQVPG